MTRFARAGHRVHFVEEPVLGDALGLDVTDRQDGVQVVVPRVSPELPPWERDRVISALLDAHLARASGSERVLWYYTPMALGFARTLARRAVVYDCMDELSAFAGAPPELRERERELLALADVVFVGGASLYEARRRRHTNAHLFPSSVDVAHFSRARGPLEAPADQASIPRPRIGFFGVLDERLDAGLVADTAALRPDWHFVMIGPVVKIDPATLPRRPNVHWLGAKSYAELPGYAAGWDVAWLPFASNASTRFISPTKTPEYLAAGRPVVSTSVRDVVRLYGERGLARIADDPRATAAAIDAAMTEDPAARLRAADTLLAEMSWDRTFSEMHARVRAALRPPATRDAATGSEG